jgi:hypothetical protein
VLLPFFPTAHCYGRLLEEVGGYVQRQNEIGSRLRNQERQGGDESVASARVREEMSAYFQIRDFGSNIRMKSAPGSAPVRGLNHLTES